jgi:hypothetical protein
VLPYTNCVVITRHHSPSSGPPSASAPHASSVDAPRANCSSASRFTPMRPTSVIRIEATTSAIVT